MKLSSFIYLINFIDYIQFESSQMYNQVITNPTTIPIQESARKSTDVCCTVLSAILAIVLFILACIFFSNSGLNSAYFDGTDASSITAGNDYSGFKAALFWTALAALGLGLLWMTLVHFIPKEAPLIAAVLAALVLLTIAVLALVTNSSYFNSLFWKILIAVIALGLMVIIICMACLYQNSLRLQGIFLDYARRFNLDVPFGYLYILIFLVLTVGLFALFIFQHCAFSSKVHSNGNFFDFSNPGFLGVLNILELIWGLQFLRDAFNFCVSGNAVDWYWNRGAYHWYSPLIRLVTRHWGSVVSGSFLNAFFEIPTLIYQLFTCHRGTCCNSLAEKICSCSYCSNLFDLVRTDVYSYINLTGIPYCNSARECARICHDGGQFVGDFNPLKHYRFVAHVFLVALTVLLGYLFTNLRVANISFWNVAALIVVADAILTWFIDISADSAESIATSFFFEFYLSKRYDLMKNAIPFYRQQIEHRSNRVKNLTDGNC